MGTSVGDCDILKKYHRSHNISRDLPGCKSLPTPHFMLPGVNILAKVLWVDGLHTVTIQQITVLPEAASGASEIPGQYGGPPTSQRWGLRVRGKFDALSIWMLAVRSGLHLIDGFVCCPKPFHFMMQASVRCTGADHFYGNVTVDDFKLDPIHFSQTLSDKVVDKDGNHGVTDTQIGIELGGTPEIAKKAIMGQIETLLVKKTGGGATKDGSHPFVLTEMLNKIIWYNSGQACPTFKPTSGGGALGM